MAWIKCPICGEDHMEFKSFADHEEVPPMPDFGMITCTNLNCASNGGKNESAWRRNSKTVREALWNGLIYGFVFGGSFSLLLYTYLTNNHG